MNWTNVLILAPVFLIVFLVWLRIERRRRWLALLFLVIPIGYVIYRWAEYSRQFTEALVSLAVAFVAAALWWRLHGRHLPPPTSDTIKVWGQDH